MASVLQLAPSFVPPTKPAGYIPTRWRDRYLYAGGIDTPFEDLGKLTSVAGWRSSCSGGGWYWAGQYVRLSLLVILLDLVRHLDFKQFHLDLWVLVSKLLAGLLLGCLNLVFVPLFNILVEKWAVALLPASLLVVEMGVVA